MEYFGWLGTCLFILCYVPQIWRTKKTREVTGVSTIMWCIQQIAYSCCLVYAVYLKSAPLMFGYAMGWLLTAWWLELYRQYR